MIRRNLLLLLLCVPVLEAAADPVIDAGVLSLEGARAVAAAAVDYATTHEAPGGAIAIVDTGGHVILLERLDNTFPAAADISIGKARTAVLFRKPTRVFEDLVNKGRTTMVTLPALTDFTPLQGGVPLEYGGAVVGAIGVSGAASAQQDDEIASAAAEAFGSMVKMAAVQHLKGAEVGMAFVEGRPLVEESHYKVHASRRDEPGEAEVHLLDTDIFYVLEGSAQFVTGGALLDSRAVARNELRGSGIDGGAARELGVGDVITVPAGVPHWFERVDGPFVYYVVKSTSAAGS